MVQALPHVGRGHCIPAPVVQAIIGRVSAGESIVLAASRFGYTDRSVHRAAQRDPAVRAALTEALGIRGYPKRIHRVVEPPADPVELVAEATDPDCPTGCTCDVCEAERLLARRRAARDAG